MYQITQSMVVAISLSNTYTAQKHHSIWKIFKLPVTIPNNLKRNKNQLSSGAIYITIKIIYNLHKLHLQETQWTAQPYAKTWWILRNSNTNQLEQILRTQIYTNSEALTAVFSAMSLQQWTLPPSQNLQSSNKTKTKLKEITVCFLHISIWWKIGR